ncbi:MAG: hypothetical protein BWX80_03632 [Candidatus Hydrogenedentes bacterium ADurb.Bin101]|nr:MAG: hypothetical protein BWX80_03632 [Candidatus Hydrogenedentes bacterium ADurb.Bin101]
MAFPVLADNGLRFRIGQVLDALLGAQVELDPESLVLGINHAKGVASEPVHVPVGGGDAPVAHDHGNLVQRLGQGGPEIPVVQGAAQVGARVALDGVIEVGELQRVAQEENGRIVADQVPVAFFRVEFRGETANITFRISGAPFARHGGKSGKSLRFLADFGKNLCPGIACNIVGHGKSAEGAGTFGVHAPFRDDLPVEVGEFFEEPDVLQQLRAPWSCRQHVLIVGHRCAPVCCQSGFLGIVHGTPPVLVVALHALQYGLEACTPASLSKRVMRPVCDGALLSSFVPSFRMPRKYP